MSPAPDGVDWPALARRLLEPGAAERLPDGDAPRRALAWALKDLCHEAWNSAPQRAGAAALALRRLCDDAAPGATGSPAAQELRALADWTEGIAQVTRGQMGDAATSFDRAQAAFLALGQADHAAQTQVPKIVALIMLGRHAEAAACGERTLRDFIAQGDRRAAGKVSLNLGSLQMRRDDYAQAAARYREAAVLFARVGDREHSVMADVGLADALTALGDLDEALRIYARARMRAASHGFPVIEALVDESVALLQLARGQYREALAGFESSRRRYEQLAMPQHLAIAEKQLGDAYLELRLLPEALALFDPALRSFEALDMPDDQAWTLTHRGRALALLGRPAQAAEALAQAAGLFDTQHNLVGQAAVALARAELALAGGQAADALPLARQAVAAFSAAGQADGLARADVALANALLQGGHLAPAGAQFDTTLQRARVLHLLPVQVRCLTGQGLVARALGDDATADAAFEAAIELFEDQRRALPGDEIRGAFLGDHLLPYQALLRSALAAQARAPSAERALAVLQALDRFRARVLSDRLAEGTEHSDDAPNQALRARLNWLYRRLLRTEDDTVPSAALTAELREVEQALLETARRQRLARPAGELTAPDATAPAPAVASLGLPALQARLGDDAALVEYGVIDDELFACVVDRGGLQVLRRLASWSAVLEALRAARFQIETLRHGGAALQRHLPSLTERATRRLQALHALVWAPLAGALAGRPRLVVVPHGQLGSLPFAALHDGRQFLAQQHQLTLAPSARLALHGLARQPVAFRQALALGESSRLPHAASEARRIAGLFEQGQALVGEQASLAALRSHAGQADVLHLACHAQFRPDNPMFSALHLADGALTVELAQALALKPGIVVLSACETGLAEQGGGDEAVGLVRAFLVAGAARVLASLWPVDDAVTEQLMTGFYRALRDGLAPAAALQQAQTATLQRHPHPFYWAAFTLHGGW